VRGAEGEWYERHTISQDLPQLATDALVAGWDTRSLRVLAGEAANAYPPDRLQGAVDGPDPGYMKLAVRRPPRSGRVGLPYR
jgi:hypothetical protein